MVHFIDSLKKKTYLVGKDKKEKILKALEDSNN
jgi:hypothetical protein